MALDIPPELLSTLELVDRAYPEGVPPDEYLAVLYAFSEYLCHRSLALLAAHCSHDDKPRLHDALKAIDQKPDTSEVMRKLAAVGFQEWVDEEES